MRLAFHRVGKWQFVPVWEGEITKVFSLPKKHEGLILAMLYNHVLIPKGRASDAALLFERTHPTIAKVLKAYDRTHPGTSWGLGMSVGLDWKWTHLWPNYRWWEYQYSQTLGHQLVERTWTWEMVYSAVMKKRGRPVGTPIEIWKKARALCPGYSGYEKAKDRFRRNKPLGRC